MTIHYRITENSLVIVGHTYPHKEKIKALGGRFDRLEKVWKLDHNVENLSHVKTLCTSLGGGEVEKNKLSSTVTKPLNATAPVVAPSPAALTNKDSFSVTQLVADVQMAIANRFPRAIWVIGEIQNLNERASGMFFSLSEPKSEQDRGSTVSINATLWKNVLANICKQKTKTNPIDFFEEGMKVRVLCQVNLYKDRGQVSLNIVDIDEQFTKGALALAREALMKDLRSKGLDRKNKSLKLPTFPFHIGLISAEGSRAKSDFLDQLDQYHFCGKVSFVDARMQGEQLTKEVTKAIHLLSSHHVDLIVLTRGGGSAADLRWFDTKEVAYAVAECSVPILAAIGHHDDLCVAEEISFRREKTPTAAADFIIAHLDSGRERVRSLSEAIVRLSGIRLESLDKEYLLYKDKLIYAALENINHHRESLDRLKQHFLTVFFDGVSKLSTLIERQFQRISQTGLQTLQKWENQLHSLEKEIAIRNPKPWLEKGWTQLFSSGTAIKSVKQVHVGEQLNARLLDGTLNLEIKDLKEIESRD